MNPPHSSVSRACPTRRSRHDMAAIRAAIRDVIGEDPPMTVRQVFYQLVSHGVIEKTEAQYQGTVIRLMTEMRLSGTLPYSWVVDESRRVRITQTYDNVRDAIEQTAKFYRRSALAQSDDYVEIWCEKDALAGAMWDVTSKFDVPLMVSRGMPSITFLHGSALEIRRAVEHGKQSYVYQFGDHDPSGVLIPQTIERRLDEMCRELDCPPPIVRRVALTEVQIRRHRLPTRPTKRAGNSHAAGFEGDSVELDALPPRILRDMVRKAIERHVSPAADHDPARGGRERARVAAPMAAGGEAMRRRFFRSAGARRRLRSCTGISRSPSLSASSMTAQWARSSSTAARPAATWRPSQETPRCCCRWRSARRSRRGDQTCRYARQIERRRQF